ncbi:uncharacterized protein LOC122255524 [Penaeus japonicus]|uniref:uncharacterized protein LOC122255524 n=1 Tax=Penaeus japonicus TaxID=27405 RepID=UPI001C70E221|nr:uncharacterized protein LOC122255524 [Penaeus japonicus]
MTAPRPTASGDKETRVITGAHQRDVQILVSGTVPSPTARTERFKENLEPQRSPETHYSFEHNTENGKQKETLSKIRENHARKLPFMRLMWEENNLKTRAGLHSRYADSILVKEQEPFNLFFGDFFIGGKSSSVSVENCGVIVMQVRVVMMVVMVLAVVAYNTKTPKLRARASEALRADCMASWRSVAVLLVAAAAVAAATEGPAEAVVERPAAAAAAVASGAATLEDFDSESQVLLASGRQGAPHGRGMLSMAFDAMNPVPYFMGGLRGVRQVMQQRLVPFRGMMLNNFQRNLPRPGSRFRGGGGSKNALGLGGRGFRGGGGGGGGKRPLSSGLRGGNGGGPSNDFLQGSLSTTKQPSNSFTSTHNPSLSNDFGTLKPASIVGGKRPSLDASTRTPSPISDIGSTKAFSQTTSTPAILTNPPSASSILPASNDKEGTRVINIQIPKELQDIPVLEINMKPNGDISIGPGGGGTDASFSDTQTSTATADLPDAPDSFSQDFDNGDFDSSVDNPGTFDYNSPLRSGQEGFDQLDTSFQTFPPESPGRVNSIQDILRMQNLGTTNNVFGSGMFDVAPMTRMQPLLLDNENGHTNDPVLNNVPNSFSRHNLLSNFPSTFPPDRNNVNHIYFVPFNMQPTSPTSVPAAQNKSQPIPLQTEIKSVKKDSPIYYIDITLPGQRGNPIVKTSRAKRSLQYDFDGWFPLDVSNPMADDPTVGYQPPPLTQVHFSAEPMAKKPMYPVRPENPPVFVVRSEKVQPEYDAVYGTENIEYFHIHPQTNVIRAFRSPSQNVGAIRFVSAPQFGEGEEQTSDSPKKNGSDHPSAADKEPGTADQADDYAKGGGEIQFSGPEAQYDMNYEDDMDGAFSEIHPTMVRGRPGHIFQYSSGDYEERPSLTRRQDYLGNRNSDRTRSRVALYELLGNHNPESQIEEAPYLGSATDSAGVSNIRKVLPPTFFRNLPNRRPSTTRTSPGRAPSRREGEDYDEASPSSTRSWFLIETRSERPDRKREPSIASYIHPETHSGDEKIHYKPYGPVSYIPRGVKRGEHIHNPHLDDHMNSYKPSTSLTANSLSELLQIFRYTQVTDLPKERGATENPTTLREFRYTRPTEEPPTTPPTFFPSSLRYTTPPPTADELSTDTAVTEKEPGTYFDAVADTNSLDGYLFSDSEASPEYARPQLRPNVVIIESKDSNDSKGVVRESSTVRVVSTSSVTSKPSETTASEPVKTNFEDLEVIFSGSKSLSSPLYVIHQGHSKVRVFGINSAEDKSQDDFGFNDKVVFSTFKPASSENITSTTSTTSTTTTTSSTPTPTTSTTTSTTTESTTVTSSTATTTLSTTPFLVDEDTATDATPTDTTPEPSTQMVTEYELLPVGDNDEYEYYYYDDGVLHDMAVGDDYRSEGGVRPTLKLPNPPLPRPSREAHGSPLVSSPLDPPGLDAYPSPSSFSYLFQERLPHVEPLLPQQGESGGAPAQALAKDTLSVPRAVFFTKRQPGSQNSRDDVRISHPFEYLSELSHLEKELRKPLQTTTTAPSAHSPPQMKRVTSGLTEA